MLPAALVCLALAAPAPEGPAEAARLEFHHRRVTTQLAGMGVLTGWAAANIVGGVAGNFVTRGEVKYFHQMNAMWNTVNLALGAIGLHSARRDRTREQGLPWPTQRERATRSQIVFAINVGLDALYIMAGATTLELGRLHDRPRLTGYGASVVLQGTFLLAFDALMIAAHGANLRRFRAFAAPTPTGALIGLRGAF